MDTIRVIIANASATDQTFLRKLVQSQVDMQVVAETSDPIELLLEAGEQQADVVFLATSGNERETGLPSHLLAEYSNLLIVTISAGPQNATIYRQTICRETVASANGVQLLDTIRMLKQQGF